MGIKNVADLNPLNPAYPDALNPTSKQLVIVPFQILRADTTVMKQAVIPADATILGFRIYGQTASNAGTSANITLTGQGVGPGGQAFNFGTFSVLAGGVGAGTYLLNTTSNPLTGVFNLERPPATQTSGDIIIYGVYAEVGTASNAGGPWNFVIEYVR
jgi:hypothetical protein